MIQRGRKSADAIATIARRNVRPEPPSDLPEEARAQWRRIVASLPQDWFATGNLPLLESYCRYIVDMRHTAETIDKLRAQGKIEPLQKWLKLYDAQAKTMSLLATRMRLTQQSTYEARKARHEVTTTWD